MKSRILVVDDEPEIRRMVTEMLSRAGYDVVEASDGKLAIEALNKQSFDLVIADILMPEKDGLEIIMYLQRERPMTKCIAMSAPSNRVFLQSAELLGATRVIEKPFTAAEMEATVSDVLGPSL